MRPGVIYGFNIDNAEKQSDQQTPDPKTIFVEIHDTDNLIPDDWEPQFYEMIAADSPIRFSTIDNDEDKFTPVKSTQVTFRVRTTNNINMSIFAGGSDQRWKVYVKDGSDRLFFTGFLSLSDLSEEWMPHPNTLVLTATDNLGLLKNIPFRTYNPGDYFRISEYLAWSLLQTGLSLQLNAIFNIRAVDFPTAHFFNSQFLNTKTFEDEIGTYIDCRKVLEKILGEGAVLFQRAGEWWILRLDEIEQSHDYYVTTFNSTGQFIAHLDQRQFAKVIQKDNSIIFFSQELTGVVLNRPLKSIKLIFNYEFPKEIPCNSDFSRGDFVADLADEVIDSVTYSVKSYNINCWTYAKNPFSPDSMPAPDEAAYIKRLFFPVGYEKQRYAVLPFDTDPHALFSEAIFVNKADRFSFSADFAWKDDKSGGGTITKNIYIIYLKGDDGTKWSLDNDNKWYSTSDWFANLKTIQLQWVPNDVDETKFRTVSVDADPTPVSGRIYIALINSGSIATSVDDTDVYFNNLSFTYQPFINGSYQKYNRQYHEIIRATDADKYAEKREREVFISDAPAKLFKGALFSFNGSNYVLSGLFWNRAVFPGGVPAVEFQHPYGEIQVFDVWNQFRNFTRVFHGNLQGLQTTQLDYLDRLDMASLLHKWYLNDTNQHTTNKYFALLTYDIDLRLCEWKGLLKEVYDINIGKVYTDTHNFKYE